MRGGGRVTEVCMAVKEPDGEVRPQVGWVWLARVGFIAHAFAGVERAPLERLAKLDERHVMKRLARCGAVVRRADELSESTPARRCRSCERRLAAGGEPRWMERARRLETPARVAPAVFTDNAQGLALAERIARDVARELIAAAAPDYVHEAMRSAAAGAALMVAERIRDAARPKAPIVDLDAWRASRARSAAHG